MRDAGRPSRGSAWPDVVVRVVVALAAGGFLSWYIYSSVVTWVPLAFLAAFVGVDLWTATVRVRSARRSRRA